MRGFWRSLGPHKVPLFSSAFGMQDPLKLPYEQSRGYPTQKHQKLILAAQKRNRARKLQKLEETEVDFVTSQKSAALRKTVLKSKRCVDFLIFIILIGKCYIGLMRDPLITALNWFDLYVM